MCTELEISILQSTNFSDVKNFIVKMHEAYTATQLLKLPLSIESLCRYGIAYTRKGFEERKINLL